MPTSKKRLSSKFRILDPPKFDLLLAMLLVTIHALTAGHLSPSLEFLFSQFVSSFTKKIMSASFSHMASFFAIRKDSAIVKACKAEENRGKVRSTKMMIILDNSYSPYYNKIRMMNF